MQLVSGQRVGGQRRDVYVVGESLPSSGACSLHRGRKVFYNYRYDEREYYEAAEDEWIEVRIRSLPPASTGDREAIAHGRELMRYEATAVLGRLPGWFAEPIDWLDDKGEPLLVMSVPQGQPLPEWRASQSGPGPGALRIAGELLNFLEALHRNDQILGGFGPDDILVDETGRICCRATERVTPAARSSMHARRFPPEIYPRGFSAPESLRADGVLDLRSDLYSWAAVFVYLLSDSRSITALEATNRGEFDAALERLAEAAPNTLRAMSPRTDRRPLKKVVSGWSAAVDCSLADDPRARPSSVDALRRIVMPRTPFGALLRFFRKARRHDSK